MKEKSYLLKINPFKDDIRPFAQELFDLLLLSFLKISFILKIK